jgi:methyltransferase (TIGR00027 family)
VTAAAEGRGSAGQDRPSFTAEVVCAQRAGETRQRPGRRLIDDPYARHFVQSPLLRAVASTRATSRLTLAVYDWRFPGYHAEITLRNPHWERTLQRALADGVDQVVNLGAGYDSTAFRLDLGDARVWEVDAPPTQEAKRSIVQRRGLEPKSKLTFVPCDFERDAVYDRLAEHGFQPERRSVVLWFGVVFFLTEDAAHAALADIARLTSPGSTLLWDYMDQAVIDGTTDCVGAQRVSKRVARRGEPYRFGLTRAGVEPLMSEHGFRVVDHVRIPDLVERYAPDGGAWCRADDFMGLVTAERAAG